MEEVPVLAHVLDGSAVLEGRELLELIAPNVLLEHDVLVLADLLDLAKDSGVLRLLELLLGPHVALGQLLIVQFRLDLLLVVILEAFSGLVESLEVVHHVSQPDIDFQLVDVLEDLSGLDLAADVEGDLRPVEAEAFLVHYHDLRCRLVLLVVALHVEDLLVLDLGDAHDQQRDQLPELRDALPEPEDDRLLEEAQHGVKDLQVHVLLVALFDECLDELEDAFEVKLLLLFLLALEGALGAVDVLLPDDASLLALVAVPPADVLDGLDGGELDVVDVDVVSDPHEGFVYVNDRVQLHPVGLEARFVQLSDLLVELGDLRVEEDDCDDLQGHQGGDVFDGVVVLVHADVCEQVDEVEEVVPLWPPVLEVLGDGRKVLLVQRDLHALGLDLAEGILRVLHLILLGLHLEAIAVLVDIVLEELLKDDVLVFLEHSGLTVDEGREQSQVLGGQLAASRPGSLGVEALDQIIDLLLGNGRLDGRRVVLQDANQAFLDVFPVDILGVLEEEIDPPREVKFVLLVPHHYLL